MPAEPALSGILGIVFGLAFTLLAGWCVIGVAWRLVVYGNTPQRLPIPLMPAASTRLGVLRRLLAETFLFRSLWRASRITWIGSISFHYGLLLVLLTHLRFLFELLPLWLLPLLMISDMAAFAMLIGLGVLLARRALIDRLRYVSTPADYLYLLLLIMIGLSGVVLKRQWPTDLQRVGEFVRSLGLPPWSSLPADPVLLSHLALVLIQ